METPNDAASEVKYRAISQTVRLIYKKEGLKAFTKGIGANILIFVPSTALTWGTYELMISLLGASHHSTSHHSEWYQLYIILSSLSFSD